MSNVLVTGGAGFFGGVLLERLLQEGATNCTSVDLAPPTLTHPNLRSVRADIRDTAAMGALLEEGRFDVIYHCAAVLAHASPEPDFLWSSNVDATRSLGALAAEHGVRKLVFISSNCLWAKNFHRPVREDDPPDPIEIYGRSKWAGEQALSESAGAVETVIIRTPTIVDSGRLGLLAILFDFIREGRRVWVVGGGHNRYQFVYAPDLAEACLLAAEPGSSGVFNVGSDDVPTIREVYEYVIERANTKARVAALPKGPTILAMRLANLARISPLGPYHYRMISEDFEFDTSRIKAELGWKPTVTNGEMLFRAYEHYDRDYDEIQSRTDASAHRSAANMGAIKLLKWIS